MNESILTDSRPGTAWPTDGSRARVPNTSMLPGSERAPSGAVRLLKRAVRGAHDGVDRLAGRATPAARRLGDTVSAAGEALRGKTHAMSGTRDDWVEDMRSTVRRKPLACVAAAFALGTLIARISR